MRRLSVKIIAVIFCLLISLSALAQPYRFHVYSGGRVAIGWDASTTPDVIYQVVLFSMSNNKTYASKTTGLSVTVTIPKVGVYEIRVRACHKSDEDNCSEWIKSTNPDDVAMEEGAFLVEAELAPAGKPIFEKENENGN